MYLSHDKGYLLASIFDVRNACEFYYISQRNNLPIRAKGIERSWSELQQEFERTGPGYPGATYYRTISAQGPQLFAAVNNKWVFIS